MSASKEAVEIPVEVTATSPQRCLGEQVDVSVEHRPCKVEKPLCLSASE